ncbi:hypothetical protein CspeluHIS016_0903200 [Cutaneotrichosporon spelunceum]|uniref:CBM1 domain-containing protein n=1 Tax=Cutaneotrichosporon spelunceum TaxID=1672016 RepID=A0AAD3U050_9TREE|nr:hypothetical protein CspeluHIS016_0903200 [Cutaneotrichosporon spelunceum]
MRFFILLAATASAVPIARLTERIPNAEAVAEAEPQWGGCGGNGGPPCWKKDALPEAEPEVVHIVAKDAEAEPQWGGCTGNGGPPCWKKDALPEAEPEVVHIVAKDAEAEPQWGGCGGNGGPPCWKKDALPEAEPEVVHIVAKDAEAEPQWGGCGGNGGPPCWKKDALPEAEPEVSLPRTPRPSLSGAAVLGTAAHPAGRQAASPGNLWDLVSSLPPEPIHP